MNSIYLLFSFNPDTRQTLITGVHFGPAEEAQKLAAQRSEGIPSAAIDLIPGKDAVHNSLTDWLTKSGASPDEVKAVTVTVDRAIK